MKKIFISYCTKNKELAEAFIEFLQLGMGIAKQDIFCTAYLEMLETGGKFSEKIRQQLQNCEAFVSLITEEYLKSAFCLVEMGAAWGQNKRFFPLVTVPFESLNHTPFQGIQMRPLDSIEALSAVYDEFHKQGILESYQTAEFHKRVVEFQRKLKNLESEDCILEKDHEGYYKAVIEGARKLHNDQYRCYKIKGHIAEPPDGMKAESDWLFYWAGAFMDLQVGNYVKFKTTKSKVNTFSDIGRARNIYPDELWKVD